MPSHAGPRPRLDVILIGYETDRTGRALALLDRILNGLPAANRLLVWNNSSRPVVPATGWALLGGSNALGEFSGWHEGLAWIPASEQANATLFVNDTVGTRRHLSLFQRWALRREISDVRDGPVLVDFTGQRVGPEAGMSIADLPLHGWMSSFCFVLTAAALQRLGGRLYDPDEVESCVRGGSDEATFFTDRVSPALRRYLMWWLLEGWHRSEALTTESQDRLAFKARCICAELLLSARCWALGIESRDPMERHPLAGFLDRANSARWALLSKG